MIPVVIGITYGSFLGLASNWLLFRRIAQNRRNGLEPLHRVGSVFMVRYLLDALLLIPFAYLIRDPWAIVASVVSLSVAVKLSLFRAYVRKGGRFD